jgi:hypothetical protein
VRARLTLTPRHASRDVCAYLLRGRLPYTIFNSSYMTEDPAAPWEFDMAKPPGKTYKYYTGPNALWPFGAGISCTEFEMTCTHTHTTHGGSITDGIGRDSGSGNHSFSCTVHNTGTHAGDEVIMVFQRPMANVRAKAVRHQSFTHASFLPCLESANESIDII